MITGKQRITFLEYSREASEIGLLFASKDETAAQRYTALHVLLINDDRVTKRHFAELMDRMGGPSVMSAYISTVAPR